MKKPLISVIIPLYNKEDSIKETVNSVLRQSFVDFELLIVDDGSVDNSLNIIKNIKDHRIKILSKPNGGVSDARNYGVKNASGEFIFFLDADDLLLVDCLNIFNNLTLKYKEEDVFVSNYQVSDGINRISKAIISNKNILFKNSLKSFWNQKMYPRTGAMLIRKQCFDIIGFFDTRISMYEDLDFLIKLFKNYRTVFTYQVTFLHLLEYNSLSKKNILLNKNFAYYINLKGTSFYEKLLLSENVYTAYTKFKRNGFKTGEIYLFERNRKYILFIIFMLFYRKLIAFKNIF